MSKITVVTSIHQLGYDAYGYENLNTFLNLWSNEFKLIVYSEDELTPKLDGVSYLNLYEQSPSCKSFVERNKTRVHIPPYKQKPYKNLFIKFCYKVYSMCHAVRNADTKFLIWLDADMITKSVVTKEMFSKFINNNYSVSYMNRENAKKHRDNPASKLSTETGFFIVNASHPDSKSFFTRYEEIYNSDELFKLNETHDGFVFDFVIEEMETLGHTSFRRMSNGITDKPVKKIFGDLFAHEMGNKKWQEK